MQVRHIAATVVIAASLAGPAFAQSSTTDHRVRSLTVTILSTMLADKGIGEWGFAALVEADGHRLLFDTGARPDTVLINAKELNVDLSDVEVVVLTHNHGDHTGGLVKLRRTLAPGHPRALSIAHGGRGILFERAPQPAGWEPMTKIQADYEAAGGRL